jgi:hypothetical protein
VRAGPCCSSGGSASELIDRGASNPSPDGSYWALQARERLKPNFGGASGREYSANDEQRSLFVGAPPCRPL